MEAILDENDNIARHLWWVTTMSSWHQQNHINDKSSRKNNSTIFSLVSAAGGLAVVVFAFTGFEEALLFYLPYQVLPHLTAFLQVCFWRFQPKLPMPSLSVRSQQHHLPEIFSKWGESRKILPCLVCSWWLMIVGWYFKVDDIKQMSESPALPGWYNNTISLADRCKLPKVCSN